MEVLGTERDQEGAAGGQGCTANPRNSEPLGPLHGPFELFLSHRYCYPHSTVWKARFTVPSRKLRPQNKFSESKTPQRREGKTSSGSEERQLLPESLAPHEPHCMAPRFPPVPHPPPMTWAGGGQVSVKNADALFCSICHCPVRGFPYEIQASGGSKPRAPIYNYLGTNWSKW